MADVRYRILGPLEVWDSHDWVAPTAAKQRSLLAVLLCHFGRVVPSSRLQAELWGDHAPATARQLIVGYIAQLRRLLRDPDSSRLATRPAGYGLLADPDDLDANRFAKAVERGQQALRTKSFEMAAGELAEALAWWRGPFLTDVTPTPSVDAERTRLEALRLVAAECWAKAELACGRHRDLVPVLATLVAEFPLQEELRGCLLLALYRCGRQAEALESYRDLRALLAEELGLEPGPELQKLHRQILAADRSLTVRINSAPAPVSGPETPPQPWQLPAGPVTFTGRDSELATIGTLLASAGAARMTAVAIYGQAGVGKSALALHAAHLAMDHFPDGVLYADLYGATVALPPAAPHAVLSHFLRALGMREAAVPADLDEAGALFRSLVAGRRTLIVLDNAAEVTQVRPLLPSGPGCAAVITSRQMLATLDSAHHLQLPVLSASEAVSLLAEFAGGDRVASDPPAAAVLAERCAYLPLALRIAAARLATQPTWPVRALADRLQREGVRLDELAQDDLAVRNSFQVSYRALAGSGDSVDRTAARIFLLLGLLDGPDVSAAMVSVLDSEAPPWIEPGPSMVETALERLVLAQLVSSTTAGRYGMHDLLRLFAREQVTILVTPAARAAAKARVRRCYLATVRRAASLLTPAERRARGPQDAALPLRTPAEAVAWLETERANLLATARRAALDRSTAADAAHLASALFRYLDLHGYWRELVDLNRAVIAGAELIADRAGAAQAHYDLGAAYTRLRELPAALTQLQAALAIRRELGDLPGVGATLNGLGIVHRNLGQLTSAIDSFEQSLAVRRRLGDRMGEARTLDNLGQVWLARHRYDRTIACQEQALAIAQEAGDHGTACMILANLADTCYLAGEVERALCLARSALTCTREMRNPLGEAMAHRTIGLVCRRRDQFGQAQANWRAALALLARTPDSPLVSEVRALLREADAQVAAGARVSTEGT